MAQKLILEQDIIGSCKKIQSQKTFDTSQSFAISIRIPELKFIINI